ncbi:MAG: hemolysin family protein [Eubacteriales bacterium]|jgi:CBS domain containing-hemolysin-like protein
MDGDGSWRLILVFVTCLVFCAYFAGTESAFSAMNKIRMKNRADDGDKKAKKALYVVNNFEDAITTILIGNNISKIAASSIATVLTLRMLSAGAFGNIDSDAMTALTTVITTAIIFLFGEMIPKSFANDRSDTMSRACAGSLRFLMKVFTPLVAFFSLITKAVSKIFAVEQPPSITEDELYDIIDTAEEEGVMDEEQSDLLKSALEFSDTTAADIMTVRDDIYAIDISTPNEEIVKRILEAKYSRIPVYKGDLDNIVGILQIRNFLKAYMKNPKVDIKKLLTEPYFVRDNAKIDDLLSTMRQKKIYLAFVTDETNRVLGIVTIEDFLEELVGEIWDEDDVVDSDFVKLGGNRYQVSTSLPVGEVFAKMGLSCPSTEMASQPVISWVLESFGRFPEEEDSFRYNNLEVSVEEIEDGKINNVIIKVDPESRPAHSTPGGECMQPAQRRSV